MFKAVLISLAAGGVTTSLFEYFFQYNLVDLVKDKVLGLFHKASAEVKKVEVHVEVGAKDLEKKL